LAPVLVETPETLRVSPLCWLRMDVAPRAVLSLAQPASVILHPAVRADGPQWIDPPFFAAPVARASAPSLDLLLDSAEECRIDQGVPLCLYTNPSCPAALVPLVDLDLAHQRRVRQDLLDI